MDNSKNNNAFVNGVGKKSMVNKIVKTCIKIEESGNMIWLSKKLNLNTKMKNAIMEVGVNSLPRECFGVRQKLIVSKQ